MKDLILSITLNNHKFNIRTNHYKTVCYYCINDKYTASLRFGSNTRAQVEYKNIIFSGTVIKRNIWNIYLNLHPIVKKYYDHYFFEATDSKQENESSDGATTYYPENILFLYDQLISNLSELYSCIDNKEVFKDQLCEWLSELYYDIETLDEIVEHENYIDVGPDEYPIIEKEAVRKILLNECKELLLSFHQAEEDNKKLKSIITLENVIKEVPELHKIPYPFLRDEFDAYLHENNDDLINLDIYYNQSDMLYNIGVELDESYRYYVFINDIEEKIDKILSEIDVDNIIVKDEIYNFFKNKYSKKSIPSDEELKQSMTTYINDYIAFYHLYNKFFYLFNSNFIEVKWDDKTIQLFQKYDKKELPVDPQNFAEYEVYKYVIPYYRKHFFRKNSNKYKPVIEQLPTFISYATTVLDILFKHNILIDNNECVIYNECGDIDSAYEEIATRGII